MRENIWLFVILFFNTLFLLYSINELSISYLEAVVFFEKSTPLHYIIKASTAIFGQNDWGLRIPFLILHIMSALLIFIISKEYVKTKTQRVMSVLIYILLPSSSAAALVVNEASLVIFITLLFIWAWQKKQYLISYFLLAISLGVDNSFAILYLALAIYGYFRKKRALMLLSTVLFGLCLYLYGFDTAGKPRGYFLDTLGIYAAAFSPFLFLYYIYTLYRIAIKERKSILWFIAFVAFVFSFIFSIRQKLFLEDFLPFAIIAVPLMVRVFFNSYRVRLPRFRKMHTMLMKLVVSFLVFNFLLTIGNKVLYPFYENPKKHFAFKHHVAKELSFWLKKEGHTSLHVKNKRLALRLKFYGIKEGNEKKLIHGKKDEKGFKLFYFGKLIDGFYVI